MTRKGNHRTCQDDHSPSAHAIVERMTTAREAMMAKAATLSPDRLGDFEWPLKMTPDHPIAKAVGFEKAKAMLDTPAIKRSALATYRRKEIERMSREGCPVTAIAKKLDITPDYVVQVRRDLDVGNIRQERQAAYHLAEIRRLNAKGLNDRAIAAELDLSRSHVCSTRDRHGIPPAKRRAT